MFVEWRALRGAVGQSKNVEGVVVDDLLVLRLSPSSSFIGRRKRRAPWGIRGAIKPRGMIRLSNRTPFPKEKVSGCTRWPFAFNQLWFCA